MSALSPIRFHVALTLLALLVIPVAIIAFNWSGEDCYITYRYAENFGDGHGLVFNVGDADAESRVEGYSNLSFTALLALIHRLGGSVVYGSRWLAAIFAAMSVVLLGRFGLAWSEGRRPHPLLLLAPALFALHPMVHYQIGRALETTLYTFLILAAALAWTRGRPILTSLLLGLVTLSRPEGFLFIAPFGAAWLVDWWLSPDRRERPLPLAELIKLVVPWAVITGAYFLWRHAYYGHWMPNSVILKTALGGHDQSSSARLVRDWVIAWSFLPAAIPLAFAGIRSQSRTKRRGLVICALAMAHQLAFILAVGDVAASAYRHFIPIIPFACLCIGEAVGLTLGALPGRPARIYLVLACLVLNLYTVSNRDATRSRLHVRLKEFVRSYSGGLNNPLRQFAFHWRWFHHPAIRVDAESGRWLRENLPADALVAADQMGQLAHHSGHRMLDMIGLMDEHIAREGLDADYVLERDPAYVVFMWMTTTGDYTPFQQVLRDDARFAERYRPRWRLRQGATRLCVTEFHVWVRSDLDDGEPFEEVVLPGTDEDLEHWWRVLGD